MSFKDAPDLNDVVRKKLLEKLVAEDISVTQLSLEVGIEQGGLHRFLYKGVGMGGKRLGRVIYYLGLELVKRED